MENKKSKCEVEVFSRVTGFYRPVKQYNPGKKEEHRDRLTYDTKKEGTDTGHEVSDKDTTD